MKRKTTTDKGTEPRTDRFRITEVSLLASLASLAALGAVVLTIVWVLSMVQEPSAPPAGSDRSPAAPPVAGETRGAGSQPRDQEPVVETTEIFASRDPFGNLGPGRGSRAGPSGPGRASQPPWARTVELVAARRAGAEVRIDARSFTVTEGQRFAQHFRLLYVSSDCAALLFGDDQFTICEGDRLLK